MPLQDRGTEDPDDNAADALALAPLSGKTRRNPSRTERGRDESIRPHILEQGPTVKETCVPTRQLFFPLHAILVCSALDASRNRIKETGTGLHLEPPTLMYLQK